MRFVIFTSLPLILETIARLERKKQTAIAITRARAPSPRGAVVLAAIAGGLTCAEPSGGEREQLDVQRFFS